MDDDDEKEDDDHVELMMMKLMMMLTLMMGETVSKRGAFGPTLLNYYILYYQWVRYLHIDTATTCVHRYYLWVSTCVGYVFWGQSLRWMMMMRRKMMTMLS